MVVCGSLCAAERLGLPFVPPYLEQNMRTGAGGAGLSNVDGMIQGVSYASAAAGIISSSGSELVYAPSHPITPTNLMLSLIWGGSIVMILLTNLFGRRPLAILLLLLCDLFISLVWSPFYQ